MNAQATWISKATWTLGGRMHVILCLQAGQSALQLAGQLRFRGLAESMDKTLLQATGLHADVLVAFGSPGLRMGV